MNILAKLIPELPLEWPSKSFASAPDLDWAATCRAGGIHGVATGSKCLKEMEANYLLGEMVGQPRLPLSAQV
jgi:hypothetical protein